MKILYISYWGLNEGISQSSVIPSLKAILKIKPNAELNLLTFERKKNTSFKNKPFFNHYPINSLPIETNLIKRYFDSKSGMKECFAIHEKIHPDLIICRGVFAGRIGNKLFKKFKTPFIVESFEPHVDYMVNGGVWQKNGIRARLLQNGIKLQIANASAIITVSENYAKELERQFNKKFHCIPCTVDPNKFYIDQEQREVIREKLGVQNNTVGIYSGKFGGIYFFDEAFTVLKKTFDVVPNLKIILLTDENPIKLKDIIVSRELNPENFIIRFVEHDEVNKYLNAADFAFSFIKSTSSSRYCSPIKHGEYWACGLPILIPDNIGDDSDIIKKISYAGAVFADFEKSLSTSIEHIQTTLKNENYRQKIQELAFKYRNPHSIEETYLNLLP